MQNRFLILSSLSLCSALFSANTSSEIGKIIQLERYTPPSYQNADPATQDLVPKKIYEEKLEGYEKSCDANIWRMTYQSRQHKDTHDTFDVVALVATPRAIIKDDTYKALIALRGMCGEYFKNGVMHIPFFQEATKNGYIVFAPQYRGNDGGQGADHYGTDDLYDVIDLFQTAHSHTPYVDQESHAMIPKIDPEHIYMFGASRGAMQGLLAVALGARPRAMVCKATGANFKTYYKKAQQEAIAYVDKYCDPNLQAEQAVAYIKGDPLYRDAFETLFNKEDSLHDDNAPFQLDDDEKAELKSFGAMKTICAAGACLQQTCQEDLEKELTKRTVLEYVQQLNEANVPTLFFHGENDPICPVEEAQKLFDQLTIDEKKLSLFSSGHGGSSEERKEMTKKTFAWFEKHA